MQKYTLNALLQETLRSKPDNISFGYAGQSALTYREFGKQVSELSESLTGKGIRKGDKVAILSENMPNWGITFFAVTTLGAVVVPVMNEFSPTETSYILKHSKAKILFVSRKLFSKIDPEEFPQLIEIIFIDDFSLYTPSAKKNTLSQLAEEGKKQINKLKEVVEKVLVGGNEEVLPDDVASLIYTSGTTGHSKGVVLTHRNFSANAEAVKEMSGLNEKDVMLSILPLSHTIECTLGMISPVLVGSSVYYLNGLPTPALLLPALLQVRPTIMLSVPLVIEKIFRNRILPKFRSGRLMRTLYANGFVKKKLHKIAGKKLYKTFGANLRMLCIGGAPLADDVEEFLHDASFPYSVGYGLTETSPLVTGNPAETYRRGSVGRPIPGVSVMIDNPDPNTHIGEVLVKGPNVMTGYFEDPDKTAAVFTENGWFRTGDLGLTDKDGYLYIKGRSKNMILGANGKNIYPEEIEIKINEQEHVVESLVLEREGKIVAKVHLDYKMLDEMFTELKLSVEESAAEIRKKLEELKAEVNKHIPTYAQISAFLEQSEPFEKTPTMKIKRFLYQ